MPGAPAFSLLALALAAPAARAGPPAAPPTDLRSLSQGELHSAIAAAPDPSQTYELYLPSAFDPRRPWPLLLVFDPRSRGRLAAEIFVPAAERWGWIVASSNDTMSDGPWDPNVRAVNAMLPDLLARLPIEPRRIYAAGFSGGAMLAWAVGQGPAGLAGVISVGGRPFDGFDREPPRFALWTAAGRGDFNFTPSLRLDELAARGERAHRFESFAGPHSWFTSAEAARAVAWLEIVAMGEGRRAADRGIAEALYRDELALVATRIGAGDRLAARRTLAAVASSYRGLLDVAAAEALASELERDPELEHERRDEAWGEGYEATVARRVGEAVALLRESPTPPPAPRLRQTLQLPDLLRHAEGAGRRGEAGQRGVAQAFVQLAFYVPRELAARGDIAGARRALELALELRPDDPFVRRRLEELGAGVR